MQINVLGTEYEVILNAKEEDYPKIGNDDGYCDITTKQIVIAEMIQNDKTLDRLDIYQNSVVRHEIVHAFLYESGLDACSDWGRDETLVDWIALQIPKMAKIMTDVEVL